MMTWTRLALLALFLTFLCAKATAADKFALTIARKYSSPECTAGYLSVNGAIICYALERAQIANIPLISGIPTGTYSAHLRYDHPDKWRIELDNVPNRKNIQIHIGNISADTEGCILVGDKVEASNLCRLIDSATAYRKLKKAFYGTETPNSTPNKEISVTITDI
jgi:hypothetical protein